MKFLFLLSTIFGIGFSSSAATFRLEGKAFHPVTNAEITWAATNALPRGVWVYKVMPEAFSAAVVSNAMSVGHFQLKDTSKTDQSLFQDKNLIYFWNKNEFDQPRFLFIAPTLGAMKFSSQTDPHTSVENVPTSEEAETLARDILFQLGIDRSLLGDKVQTGYDDTTTKVDRQGHELGPAQVVSRGVSFQRRIDGISLAENWCFLVHFGSHGMIQDFSLKWRNLMPAESHTAFSAAQIIQAIKTGQAVLPPQQYDTGNVESIKRLTVVKATPRYYNGTGKEALEFMFPFVELEIKAEDNSNNVQIFVLQSPLFLDEFTSKAR